MGNIMRHGLHHAKESLKVVVQHTRDGAIKVVVQHTRDCALKVVV